MNKNVLLILFIITVLIIPTSGAITTKIATQPSGVEVTKVARVGGNFLEWDIANFGSSEVWVAPCANIYMPISTAPYYSKVGIIGIYGGYDGYDIAGIITDRGVPHPYHWLSWMNIPAGESVKFYSQGVIPLYARWVGYNVQVYGDGIHQLYNENKYADISTGYSDSRVPTALGTNFLWGVTLTPGGNVLTTYGGAAGSFDIVIYAPTIFVDRPPVGYKQLCGYRVNLSIDGDPTIGKLTVLPLDPSTGQCQWVASGGSPSVGIGLSNKDLSKLSLGIHVLTVDFLGDNTYVPSSCKLIFQVIDTPLPVTQ